jgi:ubiquinone/menaquinone biosynthesis C-methylase UbiE
LHHAGRPQHPGDRYSAQTSAALGDPYSAPDARSTVEERRFSAAQAISYETGLSPPHPDILDPSAMTRSEITTLLRCAALLAFTAYVLLQARKPTKWFGRFFIRAMGSGHSTMTDWGLKHVAIQSNFTILDVGCGGGRTVEKLAGVAAAGKVYGIDYAEGSVAASRAHNAPLLATGRVTIEKASVSQLPFPDNKFDLATAVETQYYWPNLLEDMREVLRVLKPGGKLIVIAETYKGGKYDKLKWPVMWLLRSSHLSADEHRDLFAQAGYTGIEIFEEPHKGWICGLASKPSSGA